MFTPTGERARLKAGLIGYGGAAFGAKTYGLLLLARVAAELWPGVQIAFFRRTYPELDGPGAAMQKAFEVFGEVAHPTDGGKEWRWDNGSIFYFRHVQNEADKIRYQSQQIDILLTDEATHFPWSIIDYLLTRNRAGGGAGSGFIPFAVLTSNPGGVGHAWYSMIFDVEKKQGEHQQAKRTPNPNDKFQQVYFIQAFLEDNQIGVAMDPGYEQRLMERDPILAKALRWGLWSIFAGQAFPTWTEDRIACDPFDIPDHWPRWRALDYGFVHPFVAGWFTKNIDTGRIYVYRAVLKPGLTDQQQARLIKEMSPAAERIPFTYASPDMWTRKTSGNKVFTSVDEYRDEGVLLTRADDDRRGGVRKLHKLLVDLPDGKPALQIVRDYYPIFYCMTVLVRDEHDPEDVKKVDGDDAFDMLKYGLTNENQPARDPAGSKTEENPLNAYFNR